MRGKMAEAYAETVKQPRQQKIRAVKDEAKKLFEGKDAELAVFGEQFGNLEAEVVRTRHPRYRQAHRRPRHQDGPPDRGRSRHPAARPRLGAVHPRRDPGAGRCHARHRSGRADHRRARGRVPRGLHDALQHASVRGRRSAPHGLARPPRDRPRQARLARAASDAAGQGQVPLHDPHRVGDHREQRLVLDGLGLRRLAVADGCRRSDGAAGGRHRHGPDQGRRALRRPVRHPGRRGSSRRHGLQGRRHRSRHHRAADGHQDHLDQRGDHAGGAGPGQGRPPAHPGRDGQGPGRRARERQRRTRRASRSSRSRRTRSAK